MSLASLARLFGFRAPPIPASILRSRTSFHAEPHRFLRIICRVQSNMASLAESDAASVPLEKLERFQRELLQVCRSSIFGRVCNVRALADAIILVGYGTRF